MKKSNDKSEFDISMEILMILDARRKVTCEYLAKRLGISTRTVMNYLEKLNRYACFVMKKGRNGGIDVDPDWHYRFCYLTREMIDALEAAEIAVPEKVEIYEEIMCVYGKGKKWKMTKNR